MHDKYDIKFDPDRLFDHFGGVPLAVNALVVGKIVKPEDRMRLIKRIQKQKERGYITSEVIASLMVASSRLGRALDPYDFLIEREK